jgi:hypothetical protein
MDIRIINLFFMLNLTRNVVTDKTKTFSIQRIFIGKSIRHLNGYSWVKMGASTVVHY